MKNTPNNFNKNLRKVMLISLSIVALFLLTACSEQSISKSNVTDGEIGKQKTISPSAITNKTKEIQSIHSISINDIPIKIIATYEINANDAKSWSFTKDSLIKESLSSDYVSDDNEILVSNVDSSLALSSQKMRYNGIVQDKLSKSFSNLPSGGVILTNDNTIDIPFNVRSINQTNTSKIFNDDSKSSKNSIIDNNSINLAYVDGGLLNTTWSILLHNRTNNTFEVHYLQDSIKLKHNNQIIK